ncbi:hypothetical protein [Nocardia brasiliensis]|nr:hypothetical protein [Nocardia brasiliensis]
MARLRPDRSPVRFDRRAELLADPELADFDADLAGAHGYGFVELNQLAL